MFNSSGVPQQNGANLANVLADFNKTLPENAHPLYTGPTNYNFQTSPYLSIQEYPDITKDFDDEKMNWFGDISRARQREGDMSVFRLINTNLQPKGQWDPLYNAKFPGVDENGNMQFGVLNGKVVNGGDIAHKIAAYTTGAAGFKIDGLEGPGKSLPQGVMPPHINHVSTLQQSFDDYTGRPKSALNNPDALVYNSQGNKPFLGSGDPNTNSIEPFSVLDPSSYRSYKQRQAQEMAANNPPIKRDRPNTLTPEQNDFVKGIQARDLQQKRDLQAVLDARYSEREVSLDQMAEDRGIGQALNQFSKNITGRAYNPPSHSTSPKLDQMEALSRQYSKDVEATARNLTHLGINAALTTLGGGIIDRIPGGSQLPAIGKTAITGGATELINPSRPDNRPGSAIYGTVKGGTVDYAKQQAARKIYDSYLLPVLKKYFF